MRDLKTNCESSPWPIKGTSYVNSHVVKVPVQGMALLRMFGVDIPTQQM